MTENVELVYIEPPESARFVNIAPTTAAQYVLYTSTTSLLPSSYDQVLKNHSLPLGSDPAALSQPLSTASE